MQESPHANETRYQATVPDTLDLAEQARLATNALTGHLPVTRSSTHYQGCWAPVDEMATVIGDDNAGGKTAWHLGQARGVDMGISSRGNGVLPTNRPMKTGVRR